MTMVHYPVQLVLFLFFIFKRQKVLFLIFLILEHKQSHFLSLSLSNGLVLFVAPMCLFFLPIASLFSSLDVLFFLKTVLSVSQ